MQTHYRSQTRLRSHSCLLLRGPSSLSRGVLRSTLTDRGCPVSRLLSGTEVVGPESSVRGTLDPSTHDPFGWCPWDRTSSPPSSCG